VIEYSIWKDINTTQQVKKVQLLVDMDKSVQKVIGVYGTESKNATEWNTMLFGNCTMEQFQKVNKSITKTTTNLITTSTILNWLTHLLTNDYTADVNYETENGGNLVENVANYNTLTTTINEKMVSALGVNNVVLGTQLKISVKEGSNIHSTVKPISLMRYLCKLVTPKGGTVLDPFMGSGTTGIGAKLEGFDFIGIEREAEYIKIAEARINAWEEEKQKKLV
jgi:DNA modification methylase